jgi:ABC-2 type transport system ATP-binding protein
MEIKNFVEQDDIANAIDYIGYDYKPDEPVANEPKDERVVLKIRNLTKRYGDRKAVDNVSLDVYAGEVFGFLGPNGAGKTTTIRMISGLANITEGEIEIGGYSIKKDFKKAVSQIGGIIENPEMYKYMSGLDNLRYYASLYKGIGKKEIWEAIRLVKMENRITEKVKKYSLGMRQRVGIAQSLLHKPKILILDEPTNGLDPAGIREMRDFLKMLAHERGYSVFISSHILSEMQLLCDRVGIVSQGRLIATKSVTEWTKDVAKVAKLKLIVNNKERAVAVLKKIGATEIESNRDLISFKIPSELILNVSIELGKEKVSIISMQTMEKSLEETFLELTSVKGTAIN